MVDPSEAKRTTDTLASKISDSRKGEEGAVRSVLCRFIDLKLAFLQENLQSAGAVAFKLLKALV